MNTTLPLIRRSGIVSLLALGAWLTLAGCRDNAPGTSPAPGASANINPLTIALAPHAGATPLDDEIRRFQTQIRSNWNTHAALERLGWLFVAKARAEFDPGYTTLAEQCALALDRARPGCPESLLLRGHTLQSRHRFKEAEPLARRLVAARGLASDHGLLGDILADLGRVDEAAGAYQSMLDLKPDPMGCARAAHIRWLKGDLDGAIDLMRTAVAGVTPRDAETAAWMHTQLAKYLLQSNDAPGAAAALKTALEVRVDFPPALLCQGRMRLGAGESTDAVALLRLAVRGNPLPEYHWALAEALRASGETNEARQAEARLVAEGQSSDPRSCSLFLATGREQPELAVRLARQELNEREDIFTHDTLAWALASAGQIDEAQQHLHAALSLGTPDARLWFHAAVITAKAGQIDASRKWQAQAASVAHLLLPREQAILRELDSGTARQTTLSNSFPTASAQGAASEN